MTKNLKQETQEEENKKEEENLTKQFFEELTKEKELEINTLSDLYNNPDESGVKKLEGLSITTEEIQDILNSTSSKTGLGDDLELIPMEDLKILDEVKNDSKKEKKQIEKYFTQILYVMSVNKPFSLNDPDLLIQVGLEYVNNITNSLQTGQIDQIKDIKERAKKTYEECLEIETPFVTKEIHQRALSLLKYLVESIDEEKLVDQNDPLGMALYIGKLQAAIIEGELLKEEMDSIIEDYEIEVFSNEYLEGVF